MNKIKSSGTKSLGKGVIEAMGIPETKEELSSVAEFLERKGDKLSILIAFDDYLESQCDYFSLEKRRDDIYQWRNLKVGDAAEVFEEYYKIERIINEETYFLIKEEGLPFNVIKSNDKFYLVKVYADYNIKKVNNKKRVKQKIKQ